MQMQVSLSTLALNGSALRAPRLRLHVVCVERWTGIMLDQRQTNQSGGSVI